MSIPEVFAHKKRSGAANRLSDGPLATDSAQAERLLGNKVARMRTESAGTWAFWKCSSHLVISQGELPVNVGITALRFKI